MNIFSRYTFSFWVLTFAVAIMLTVPSLVQDGMFGDAMLYTSVSRNLAQGIGTFWFPYFDPYNIIGIPSFHEQPPLVFGIQSLFFKLFGDHLFVERLYTFFTMCTTAFLIFILWKEIFKNKKDYQTYGWLSILLWITIPVCFWSYSNNMHENTMGIFILLSIIVMYKSLKSEKLLFANWVLAGILIWIAALSKGFPGFFSVSFPFLYWVIVRENTFKKMFLQMTILMGTISALGIMLYLYPPSKESLSIYLFKRAFSRINDAHTVDSRFFIFFRLLSELIPAVCFTALFFFISKIKKIKYLLDGHGKTTLLFFVTGLCGSLPLMLTKVQNGFYFVPSLPYFGIAFALLNVAVIYHLLKKIESKKKLITELNISAIIILCTVIIFSFTKIGYTVRDKELLHDIHLIGKKLPRFSSMQCTESVYDNWALGCYLVRYYNISVNMNDTSKYLLAYKNEKKDALIQLQKFDLPLGTFDLYKKQ